MKIDFNKIERLTGLHFETSEQLYFYILHKLEVLKVNNKNYNKKQYHMINDLFDIFRSVISED